MTRAAVRAALLDLNREAEGEYPVAVNGYAAGFIRADGTPERREYRVGYAYFAVGNTGRDEGEPVVTLPGDGRPFALASFVDALLASKVQIEP